MNTAQTIPLVLCLDSTLSLPQKESKHHPQMGPSKMQKKKNFLDLPSEIRNHIYEDYMQITACSIPDQRIKLDDLNRVADRTTIEILLALKLQRYFPFILANRQVMHEAFTFCLEACNFTLPGIDRASVVSGRRFDIGLSRSTSALFTPTSSR